MTNLSFATPIAYDYKYFLESLKSYYNIADEIFVGLDSERVSWSNKKYEINEADLKNSIKAIDKENKIKIIEDNFHYLPRPILNDTYERNYLSSLCKNGNWIVQVDSDEIILNPKECLEYFQKENGDVCSLASWKSVFKIIDGKELVISPDKEWAACATKMKASYTSCRDTPQRRVQSPIKMLHYSWGRTREELKQKLENWTHSRDFDVPKYLGIWDSITLDNYQNFKDFHPLNGPDWQSLVLMEK
jgi:hypothetical protein